MEPFALTRGSISRAFSHSSTDSCNMPAKRYPYPSSEWMAAFRGFGESHCLLWGVGIASGCQAGIISLSALTYPSAIRSPGAGLGDGSRTSRNDCGTALQAFCWGSVFEYNRLCWPPFQHLVLHC